MIQIEHIKKSFGHKQVLNELSLICTEGKIQALLGANGAGKSTLVHIISQLLMADNGRFFIDGEQITNDSFEYRTKMGYVFEKPIYVEKMTAKEYLDFVACMYQMPKEIKKNRVEELLIFFELDKDADNPILQFSKGMKSKISIAAALVHSPKYLILDEPFDGIDFLMSQKIIKLFKDLAAQRCTFLITSHQFDLLAELCDNFAILKNGTILFNRSYSEILDDAMQKRKTIKEYVADCLLSTQILL